MRSLDVSLKNNVASFGIVLAMLSAVLTAQPAHGTDTQIGVAVCGDTIPAAAVTIQEPLGDSVVDQPTVTIRGVALNATQVLISIDDQYSVTVALPVTSTSFATDIFLTPGTHTIKTEAFGICGGAPSEDTVVVTYQPAAPPSNGGITPTDIEGTVSLDGVPVDVEEIAQDEETTPLNELPVVGPVVNMVSDFATAIGLSNTIAGNNTSPVVGVARVGVTVAAITTIVMAGSIAPLAAQALPGVSELFNANSHRSMIYFGWVIRGVGAIAMALAYFL